METNERGSYAPTSVTEWFEKRSYTHEEFEDVKSLFRRKPLLCISLWAGGMGAAAWIAGMIAPSSPCPEKAATRGGIEARPSLRSTNAAASASTRSSRSSSASTS